MKIHHLTTAAAFVIGQFFNPVAYAQFEFHYAAIVPSNPSSVDSISYVRFESNAQCSRPGQRYKSIAMVNNNITITFGEWKTTDSNVFGVPIPSAWHNRHGDLVDLGRLPPGDYTLTTVGAPCPLGTSNPAAVELNKFPFKVTDGRDKKGVADPTLDYSGQWWDERDAGWGLYIWQDSANNTMAAWFTYTPDGKPAWYVFQPSWATHIATRSAEVWQTGKPPGVISPPAGATKFTTVGAANLYFYFGSFESGPNPTSVEQFATFTYKLGDGAQQTRTLKRFKAK